MITWNPDNCGAKQIHTNENYPDLARCECGVTGYNHDEHDEPPPGADETDGDNVSACTCGSPVCDECWEGEGDNECPHHVDCGCASVAGDGDACAWRGPRDETVLVEYMPAHLRASHEAANNRGVYPHNGALRVRCHVDCAERVSRVWRDDKMTDELDEWVKIVGEQRLGTSEPDTEVRYARYTWGTSPGLLADIVDWDGSADDGDVRAAGFDPADEEIGTGVLREQWGSHAAGCRVISGLTVTGHPLAIEREPPAEPDFDAIARERIADYLCAAFGAALVVWRDGRASFVESGTDPWRSGAIAVAKCPGISNLDSTEFTDDFVTRNDDGVYVASDGRMVGDLDDVIRECVVYGDVTKYVDDLAKALRESARP